MVNGPIGALLAQLTEFGWQLPEVDRWIAPGGESSVTLDPRSPIPLLSSGQGIRPGKCYGIELPSTIMAEV